jgi:creatinine amidohydrolase
MKKLLVLSSALFLTVQLFSQATTGGTIPFKMEELTSPEFESAVATAGGVCVIPLGIIEKHGPHLPLGTDLFEAREVAFTAAKKEYAVVFPPYFTGQIFEAKHQPGAMAYSTELMWKMLDETCAELSRNGLKKIILVNGHGGNNSFLAFFCQAQLASPRDYIVVLFQPSPGDEAQKAINALKKTKYDGHAGEEETSMMYYIRPDLVHADMAKTQSGEDQAHLKALPYGYTGIWWYARFPNHYAGDGSFYSRELGELLIKTDADQLAELVSFLKHDNSIENLMKEFYGRSAAPLKLK